MRAARILLIAGLLATGYLIALALNLTPWLRGPEDWRWAYALPGTWSRLWLPALLLIGYLSLATWLIGLPAGRQRTVVGLLAAGLMTPTLQLALLYMDHPDVVAPLFYRTVSPESGGFFNVGAVVVDIPNFLRHFAAHMPAYPVHPQRHPPGLPLLFAGARRLFDNAPILAGQLGAAWRPYQCHNLSLMNLPNSALASALIQMLVPVWLGLIVLPLHRLGQTLYDEPTALRAVLLWPLLPSIALWATRWNQLYALFTVLALLAFHAGLSQRRLSRLFLSGLIVSTASFFSFGNVAIAGFLGVYFLFWWLANRPRPSLPWLVAGGALFAVGLATIWLAVWVGTGLALPDVWQTAMGIHMSIGRSYVSWLFYHLYDFFVFLGIPLFVFWVAGLVGALRRLPERIDVPLLAFTTALLLLNLSGTSQGEVARVWAFLLPLFLIVAVSRFPARRPLFAGLLLLLAAQLFVSNIYLRTVGTGLTDPPDSPPPVAAEGMALATWEEGGMRLKEVGVPETAGPGETITIDAIWTTDGRIQRSYTVFVHLVDETGALVAQHDGMPRDGTWPTTCWKPGEHFRDQYRLTIPEEQVDGRYRLQLGYYWLPTGERLPLAGGHSDSVTVGSIQLR